MQNSTYSLLLLPFQKPSFTLPLFYQNSLNIGEGFVVEKDFNAIVFSDLSYRIKLQGSIPEYDALEVYINDSLVSSSLNTENEIVFPDDFSHGDRIFIDCYGYVQISIKVHTVYEGIIELETKHIPVLVKKSDFNQSIKEMVAYVYNSKEFDFAQGEPRPRVKASLKSSNYHSLHSQIQILEEIVSLYEHSFSYFHTNSRFVIDKTQVVDSLDHTQYITPKSIQYVISHPEQLKNTSDRNGITIGKKHYTPNKILSEKNICSRDIYENRVILDFLYHLVRQVTELIERCISRIRQIQPNEDYNEEYVFSSFFMMGETKKMLCDGEKKLSVIKNRLMLLCIKYADAFGIEGSYFFSAPKPTPLFLSVPQYNRIFLVINKWLNLGLYDFGKESYMLSLIRVSALYEIYIFIRLISYLKGAGFSIESEKNIRYPVPNSSLYKNVKGTNYLSLKKDDLVIELYYQPVIFSPDRSISNGIELYRNTTISLNSKYEEGAKYYAPDFIIKASNSNKSTYAILDTKFSDLKTVRRYYVRDLAFKYLFSISKRHDWDLLLGCCIIYAKCLDTTLYSSAYDKEIPDSKITPIFDLIPIMEGIETQNIEEKLQALFEKVILSM